MWELMLLSTALYFHSLGRASDMAPVLRIHDILVWIGIWILLSMPLTNGSGSGYGSSYFCHWPLRGQQRTNFKKIVQLITFLHHFSKIKKSKISNKTVGIKVFPTFFLLDDRRIRRPKNIRIQRIRIRNTAWHHSNHHLTFFLSMLDSSPHDFSVFADKVFDT
jgi:hypothetical protein